MLLVRDFRAEDVTWLALQQCQRLWLGAADQPLDLAYGEQLLEAGPAWTITDASGWIVAACGFQESYPTYATCWALLAEGIGTRHLALTRLVRERMAAAPYRRIDALILADHKAGKRWAELVGLLPAHPLVAAGPAGEDYILFERIGGAA